MDAAIGDAIRSNMTPGGVLWLERRSDIHSKAFGARAVEPAFEAATADTIYDAASLTKVLATAPAVMKLAEQERIDIDQPVGRYLPAFAANGKEAITVRQLLTHASGLRPGLGAVEFRGGAQALELACAETPAHPPGTKFVYSDINFIVLGCLVERVAGESLDRFCAREIFRPLGMDDTGYRPIEPGLPVASGGDVSRIAPTERQGSGGCLRGVVHDPTARKMGGVAGHAGVFTTAGDLAKFARMLLAGGQGKRGRVLRPETVRRMTAVQSAHGLARRGLGWDIDSPYAGPRGNVFPVGSYGHSGWTGTSLWIDPFSGTFVIFLSNRNHPTEQGNVIALRRRLGTLAAEAVTGFDFTEVPGALPRTPPWQVR
jgi:CubicO group peptidase (beta-lactamase class C family)